MMKTTNRSGQVKSPKWHEILWTRFLSVCLTWIFFFQSQFHTLFRFFSSWLHVFHVKTSHGMIVVSALRAKEEKTRSACLEFWKIYIMKNVRWRCSGEWWLWSWWWRWWWSWWIRLWCKQAVLLVAVTTTTMMILMLRVDVTLIVFPSETSFSPCPSNLFNSKAKNSEEEGANQSCHDKQSLPFTSWALSFIFIIFSTVDQTSTWLVCQFMYWMDVVDMSKRASVLCSLHENRRMREIFTGLARATLRRRELSSCILVLVARRCRNRVIRMFCCWKQVIPRVRKLFVCNDCNVYSTFVTSHSFWWSSILCQSPGRWTRRDKLPL